MKVFSSDGKVIEIKSIKYVLLVFGFTTVYIWKARKFPVLFP